VREVADRERIGAFMTALARHATADVDVYLVGGTCAVLVGWRATTIDVDLGSNSGTMTVRSVGGWNRKGENVRVRGIDP
jgi:hypothetical protein